MKIRLYIVVLFWVLLASCATYYQKNANLMNAVYSGNMVQAEHLMEDKKWEKPARNRLLFYLNKGTILWMNGKHAESNVYFQQADYFIEDYRKNVGETFLSLLTNPNYTTYTGEYFEQILLHYYATMNFVQTGDFDNALVACKRMQESLNRITDKSENKNHYRRDAFAHNLLGMIYDAQGDYNNAFIAYRNAYNIYKEDYLPQLNTPVPLQLKKDMIRTASLIHFSEEVLQYEKEFGLSRDSLATEDASLIFFWNNGMGPVKDQQSVNFTVSPLANGWVEFVNWDLGLRFPFYVASDEERKSITSLKVVRVAWPRYVTRVPVYNKASMQDSLGNSYSLELAEDINAIAYKSLDDRMMKELGQMLLRLAIKQAAEQVTRKKNEGAGLALSVLNAVTEQADTRNWQLLPYSINYTRVPLHPGLNKIRLVTSSSQNKSEEQNEFSFDVKKGQTLFHSFQTLQFNGYVDRLGKPYIMY